MNTLKKLLLSLSIASMGFVTYVRADDAEETGFVSQAADFAQDVLDDAHDAVAIVVDGAHDVATDVVEAAENAVEDIADDVKPLIEKYRNLVTRVVAKSLVEIGAGAVKDKADGADNVDRIFPKLSNSLTGDIAKIGFNTAIEEAIPQDADAGTLQNVAEALVPVIAGQVSTTAGRAMNTDNAASFFLALTQKASSKEFFVKTEGITKHALKAIDFGLSCVDAKALGKARAGASAIEHYKKAVSLRKGIAKLVAKMVMDSLVKKMIANSKVTDNSNYQKAAADILQKMGVDPICKVAVEDAFTK